MGSQKLHSPLLLLACVLCGCLAAQGCLEKERTALLQLRDSFYHPRPANLSEWPTWVGEDCCQWAGASCQDEAPRRVVFVSIAFARKPELGGMVVNGSLFAALEELQELRLSNNQISRWIEPKGMLGLKKLTSVNLEENLLTEESVSWLFNLPSLTAVYLSSNRLKSSSTLKAFCGLKDLSSLHLSFNTMEGTIDPCVSNMRSLQVLFLQGNRLTGEIPSLSKLSSLRTLNLGQNRLSGVFYFSSLANLANLTGVSLVDNDKLEVETEHPAWAPSFQLEGGLLLSGCSLNRRSGRRIPSFLSTQKNMFLLALSRTSIQGTIPAWMLDNVANTLVLDGNSLSGPFPQLEGNRTRGLSLLDLSKNKIHGPMPQNMKSMLPEL
ncbi:hypothetical protein Taro_038389 [Colocasia esculenta]|uniref:Leucine-rich repeat-containing N-terminal plant-type domain-containing protein n=1 Tax=Colocasia esculenta TaxID=4460 RepID=A0A843W827_COLES|nr:hypothetical protein [Colocasia esculenta]